ncbi:uncharacterized protein LOC123554073 [Mercenaria mercenaria]|uniref:uncharacterized protein LOC123554073 n=1 Tax=Mercenaria mercenaria TaxID=6596 RepID=UPI00234E625E|nr:uncharacterized protein LOC123554073 [Mercenaria mercenaria]
MEEEATSSQIVEVIESSATTVTNMTTQLAVVDKFALELDTVEVKMDRKLEPETFNKKSVNTPTTTTKLFITTNRNQGNVEEVTTKKPTLRTRTPIIKPTPKTSPPKPSRKKKPPADQPVYSWDPCAEYDGMYFPHPTECNMFIQCTNGEIIEQKCTNGLLYHWKQLTCVSR